MRHCCGEQPLILAAYIKTEKSISESGLWLSLIGG